MNLARTVVLLSGSGTTLQNLIDRSEAGSLSIRITRVISSRPGVLGLERASRHGIPTDTVSRKSFDSWDAFNTALTQTVDREEPDLVVLAGFMSLFWPGDRYTERIINVHPALIPAFCGKGMYGHQVHEAVIQAGVKVTGCTVHFVDPEYDHGPIILQKTVDVLDNDTPDSIAERVQAAEREALPEALQYYADKRLHVSGNRVHILPYTITV